MHAIPLIDAKDYVLEVLEAIRAGKATYFKFFLEFSRFLLVFYLVLHIIYTRDSNIYLKLQVRNIIDHCIYGFQNYEYV